ALVFRDQVKSSDVPIFLIGRVMRHQQAPTRGVGVRWEKAVHAGPASTLQDFLRHRLQISDPAVLVVSGPRGESRAIHHFDVVPPPGAAPAAGEVPDRAREGAAATAGSGPVTARIERQAGCAPAEVDATMKLAGGQEIVRIRFLGLQRMFTACPLELDVAPGTELTMMLPVQTRSGVVELTCACMVSAMTVDDVDCTLELELLDVREPRGSEGLLNRYVRWLHFNSLTQA
ncbi:MAG: hypothetical protein FJ098_17055, partial [Deltaproteobacteria bacterium]|nr:hypothetical protein [Deltaproteobacteria bacterium]